MFIQVIGTRPNRCSAPAYRAAERGWEEAYVDRSASTRAARRSRATVTVGEGMIGRSPVSGRPSSGCRLLGSPKLPDGSLSRRSTMPETRRRRTALAATVLRTERLSASLVRVVVGGPGLDPFEALPCTDSYVKVVFVHADAPRPFPRTDDGRVDLEAVAASLPRERAPRLRSYTVRAFDEARRELTLDFVVHGAAGIAGPWAAVAQPGDELLLVGPGGGYQPDATAGWHLLAGDLSAVPAIAVA